MSALAFENVSVELGNSRVVDTVSAEIGRGEWVSLIGPNGAGKSTLLRAIAGLVPFEGSVSLDGVDDATTAELDADALEGERAHVKLLLVRSTTAKNGAPKNAVTTPIGTSAGAISVRARTSARTRKPAPTRIESGTISL